MAFSIKLWNFAANIQMKKSIIAFVFVIILNLLPMSAQAASFPQLIIRDHATQEILKTCTANNLGVYNSTKRIYSYCISDQSGRSTSFQSEKHYQGSIGSVSFNLHHENPKILTWFIEGAKEDLYLDLNFSQAHPVQKENNSNPPIETNSEPTFTHNPTPQKENVNQPTTQVQMPILSEPPMIVYPVPALPSKGTVYVVDMKTNEILKTTPTNNFGMYTDPNHGHIYSYQITDSFGNDSGLIRSTNKYLQFGTGSIHSHHITSNSISWLTENINGDLKIAIDFSDTQEHRIHISSETYNAFDNTGRYGYRTCTGRKSMNFAKTGEPLHVSLTPLPGREIVMVNIRHKESDVNLFDVSIQNAVIDGTQYLITQNDDGSIFIDANEITSDVFITALTAHTGEYSVTIYPDPYSASEFMHCFRKMGEEKEVVLYPTMDFEIEAIMIMEGSITGQLNRYDTHLSFGENVYQATWNEDGSVVVRIPRFAPDVMLHPKTKNSQNEFCVQVLPSGYVGSNALIPMTLSQTHETAVRIYSPEEILQFTISDGLEKTVVNTKEESFIFHGETHTFTKEGNAIVLYLKPINSNLQIQDFYTTHKYNQVNDYENHVKINYSKSSDKETGITAYIEPEANYQISKIVIHSNGKYYEANPATDRFVFVEGVKCFIYSYAHGNLVSIVIPQSTADTFVSAIVNPCF